MYTRSTRRTRFCAFAAGLLFAIVAIKSDGGEVEDRRIEIGINIFPKLMAVDLDLKRKLRADQTAVIAIAYEVDGSAANRWRNFLRSKISRIDEFRVEIDTVEAHALPSTNGVVSGILIIERLSDTTFKTLVDYAMENGILAFSPLPGDVERGATAGIAVTSRIIPFFNMETLDKSHISIHPMLLNISKKTP